MDQQTNVEISPVRFRATLYLEEPAFSVGELRPPQQPHQQPSPLRHGQDLLWAQRSTGVSAALAMAWMLARSSGRIPRRASKSAPVQPARWLPTGSRPSRASVSTIGGSTSELS